MHDHSESFLYEANSKSCQVDLPPTNSCSISTQTAHIEMKSDAVQTTPAEHTTSVGITCDLCVQDHYVHEDSYNLASVDDDNEDSSFFL